MRQDGTADRRRPGYWPALVRASRSGEALGRRVEEERRTAPRLAAELIAPGSRAASTRLVRRNPRFRSWGMCEWLVSRAREEAPVQPEEALGKATMATEIGWLLSPEVYGFDAYHQLSVHCWICRADLELLLGRRQRAAASLGMAEWLSRGAGQGMEALVHLVLSQGLQAAARGDGDAAVPLLASVVESGGRLGLTAVEAFAALHLALLTLRRAPAGELAGPREDLERQFRALASGGIPGRLLVRLRDHVGAGESVPAARLALAHRLDFERLAPVSAAPDGGDPGSGFCDLEYRI